MSKLRKRNLWLPVLLSIAFLLIGFSNLEAKKKPLTVYFLDVGQGNAFLVTTPAGKTILLDGGMGGPGYVSKDKGRTVILPFLKEKGIKKLDMMIMTHADFDHIGGLIYLLNKTKKDSKYPLEIVEFLDPGWPGTTYLYQDLLKAVRARREIKYRQPKVGDFLNFGKGVTAQVVAPSRDYGDANNSSIVIKLTYSKVSFLLTGDAAKESEKDMISRFGNELRSTVLSAGHHGSAHSSNTPFLNCVKPEVVTISVGERNKFLLPFKEALDRLNATGAKIYRTDYEGMITITTNGKTYEVVTARKAPPPAERWDAVKVLTEEEKININTASAAELKTLPRIGAAKALDIIAHRPYKSIDNLRRVPGIGVKIVERLKPLVTVGVPGEEVVPEKKVVPEEKVVPEKKPAVKKAPPGARVNINTASLQELDSLPGIGPATARAIIAGRPYATVDELTKVRGIGAAKLEKLKPLVTVK